MVDLEGAMREVGAHEDIARGVLRLSAPESAGPLFLNDLLADYLACYPEVQVDLSYEDRKVDLVAAGLDAAIRSDSLLEQDTHAVPVGPALAMAVVASPAYIGTHGVPTVPSELTQHDGICFKFVNTGSLAPWGFEGTQGSYAVSPKPRVVVNDIAAILRLTEAGLGVAYLYAVAAAPAIAAGRLVPLLEGLATSRPRYAVNYLSKRHMPARIRAFIDMAKQRSDPSKPPAPAGRR